MIEAKANKTQRVVRREIQRVIEEGELRGLCSLEEQVSGQWSVRRSSTLAECCHL